MKLYYTPGACSLSPHIVAHELGIAVELVKVDLATKKTATGADYLAVNPKGYVPALELDDGSVLTEGPAIVQYLADREPARKLAPPNGTLDRYRLQAWLGFVNSEIHKSYSPLFSPATPPEVRAERLEYLRKRHAFLEKELQGKSYLTGEQFTVADAYLFVTLNWARLVKFDLSGFPNLLAYHQRIAARPGVIAAMKAEGIYKG